MTLARIMKFRAWEKLEKQFVYFELGIYECSSPFFRKGQIIPTSQIYPNHDLEELQQLTGLKDKNGKEIYEGDMIKISHSSSITTKVETVIYNAPVFIPLVYLEKGYGKPNQCMYAEVIGNIYEKT